MVYLLFFQLMVLVSWWFLVWGAPRKWSLTSKIFYYGITAALLLYSGVATLGDWYNSKYPMRRVVAPCDVRLGPATSYVVQDKLEKDEFVRVVETENGWQKIKKQAIVGWVPVACLGDVRVASNP